MAINVKCPNCGSSKVQLSNEEKKHGCFWFLIFGWYFIFWVIFKYIIGLMVLLCFDWWMAIIKKSSGKGYIWKSRRFFGGRRRIYYCHDCGKNFRA